MHNFLIIPTNIIPQWSKDNVRYYSLGLFSNDGLFILMDDAHPISTYQKWLGPNFHLLDSIMTKSTKVTADEFKTMRVDTQSPWYVPPEVD